MIDNKGNLKSKVEERIRNIIIPQSGVSFNENLMYMMSHHQPENDTYSSRMLLRWFKKDTPFDEELFINVLNFLVNRHEAFRTTYFQDQKTGLLCKKIYDVPVVMEVPVHRLPYEESDSLFLGYCKELGKGFFPLVRPPLLRVNIVIDVNQIAYTVIYLPHIIMDAYSNALVLFQELYSLYTNFRSKPKEEKTFKNFDGMLKLAVPYSEFVKEDREIFSKKLESAKKYYSELYKKVDHTNKYITMETQEKKCRGIFRVFDKTKGFIEFVEKHNLIDSQLFYTIFQISLLKCLKLRAVPMSKLFQNRKEKYDATMGFIAHELVFIEEIRDQDTLEDIYHRNRVSSRNTIKNFGDINGAIVARLLNLPLPRFRYNYIPKSMSDVHSDEVSYVSEPDFYDAWNWEGELFKIKFGFIPFDLENIVYLTFYHSHKDFPNEDGDNIADAILEYSDNLQRIWKVQMKDLDQRIPSDLQKSKL